jgi:hypothetical protein
VPFVALCYSNLASRARLRQTCRSLDHIAKRFDANLLNDNVIDDDLGGVRTDLARRTEISRWMSTSATGTIGHDRVERGDVSEPADMEHFNGRTYSFYDEGKLVDDHLLVLYSNYWSDFEVFDLNTGSMLTFDGLTGPNKYYVNTAEKHIALCLEDFDGRFGLLAAGMELSCRRSENPHGARSGPYLSVCELKPSSNKNKNKRGERLRIDLRKPEHSICWVSIVSDELCAVLLFGKRDPAVLLQWIRIPSVPLDDEAKPHTPRVEPPGPPPPEHNRCGMTCLIECPARAKWENWKRQMEDWSEQERANDNKNCKDEYKEADDREKGPEYRWWPLAYVLLKEDVVSRGKPLGNSCHLEMHSGGNGILVVFSGPDLVFYHVGAMTRVRTTKPFDTSGELVYHEDVYASNFVTHTEIFEMDDIPRDGYEARFEKANQPEGIERNNLTDRHTIMDWCHPTCKSCLQKIDLARFDTDLLLARFSHLTHDEQRDFEKGICGISGESCDELIRRCRVLPPGSCSPQLDCVTRVAFTLHNKNTCMDVIVVMDIAPLRQLRGRDDDGKGEYYFDRMYADACMGRGNIFEMHMTPFVKDFFNEEFRMAYWERGGIFDFLRPEMPTDDEHANQKLGLILSRIQTPSENDEELYYYRLDELRARQRFPIHLSITSYKLIVCTKYEISMWPLPLISPNEGLSVHDVFQGDARTITKIDRPCYSARPCDKLLSRDWCEWKRHRANDHLVRLSYASPRKYGIHEIIRDIAGFSVEEETRLYYVVRYRNGEKVMTFAFASWRYLAIITNGTSQSCEMVHLFDALANWTRVSRGCHEVVETEGQIDGSNDILQSEEEFEECGVSFPSDHKEAWE